MSSADKQKVITYKELIFMVFVFGVILVALYPKDLLKQQIVSEKANYDLSMLYLKNLLKHNPEDESLMLILATQSLKSGKKDLAIRLLELLFQSKNLKIRQKATLLSYDLEKERYFAFHDPKQKRQEMFKLRKIFLMIYYNDMFDKNDPEALKKWYNESLFVQVPRASYELLKLQVKQHPEDIALLQQGFYLSIRFNKRKDSFYFIDLLKHYDKGHMRKWILQEYYMYMNYKEYAKAEHLLVSHMKDDKEIRSILGDFYLFRKQYRQSSSIFLTLYREAKDSFEKRVYFKKALQALAAGNYTKEATALAKANEAKFLNDSQMRQYILKVYLSANMLDAAAELSKKILQEKYHR